MIIAEHLHAVDCRRRAFAIFAIEKAEDHRVLHRIAAAAEGFFVRRYHFLSNRLLYSFASSRSRASAIARAGIPSSTTSHHCCCKSRTAANHVHLLLYSYCYQTSSFCHRKSRRLPRTELGSFWANIEPLPSQESENIEHRTK